MMVTITPDVGIRIDADENDGFVFATRQNQAWPASELRHSRAPFFIEVDARTGDLLDTSAPEDTPSNELSAFIEFALERARDEVESAISLNKERA